MSNDQPVKWQPLEPSEQDLEFMAHQEDVARQICSVFAISPQELGVVGNTSANEWEITRRAAERGLKRGIVKVLRERQKA